MFTTDITKLNLLTVPVGPDLPPQPVQFQPGPAAENELVYTCARRAARALEQRRSAPPSPFSPRPTPSPSSARVRPTPPTPLQTM